MSYFDFDAVFNMDGQSYGVLPDVSQGDAPMQPTTATGNGYGYSVNSSWMDMLGGTLQSAVNYAILRDQQKIAQQTGYVGGNIPLQPTPQTQATLQNNRLLVYGALGIGLLLVLRGGK
ncbi:hypothetical protein [Massilia timonae]|uniref:hypothetical protein n=1 Tax=Massilia timonae TaxID=47229 RepID=UPI0028D89761|nr:hypothetical protein [Massilia timonae]